MARYIDAELFADRLLNAWDTADKEKKSEIVAILSDIVIPILVGTPTADVAPRAEVAKLHEVIFKKEDLMQKIAEERNKYADELETAKDSNEHLAVMLEEAKMTIGVNAQKALEVTLEEIENAKREVAREIFEEIEECAESWCGDYYISIEKLYELKKKYAEGRNER